MTSYRKFTTTVMAEATVENRPTGNRFYCHTCSAEISPKPNYTCPQCDDGFIEEITEEFPAPPPSTNHSHDVDPAAQFAELWGRAFLENFQNQASGGVRRPETGNDSHRTESEDEDEDTRPHPHGLPPHGLRPFTRVSVRTRHRAGMDRQPQYLQGLLQLFVDRLTGEMGQHVNIIPAMHGNPGDYAWGVGGLDNIITQLLNQLEGSGPAPAEKRKIDALPVVKVTQSQVDNTLQCSICMDDFKLGEEAKKLPCDHHYHKSCIVTWLEMHGTCPVCRKDLNGIDSSLKNDDNLLSDLQNINDDRNSGADGTE